MNTLSIYGTVYKLTDIKYHTLCCQMLIYKYERTGNQKGKFR